jgi:hypothetical protein
MPTNAKVAIELYVDDKGTLRVREFKQEAKDSFDDVEKSGSGAAAKIKASWDKLKGAWVEITAGIMAMREAWNLANMAAKAEQEKQAFASLAASYGANAGSIIASLKRVSAGTVDTMTMIRSAGTAMMMGIAPDEIVKLMEIARATAKMTGQDTVTAFNDISLAVGRQSKMILDNLGIIIDVEKANSDYAASLHKTAAQLTDVERKQAFMAATMKGGAELISKLGQQTDTNADKLQRWSAKISDYKLLIGDLVVRGLNFIDGTFNSIAAGALFVSGGIFKIIQGISSLTDKLGISSGAAAEWKMNAEAAFGAADELAQKAGKAFEDMKGSNDIIIKGQAAFQKQIKATTEALTAQDKIRQKLLDANKAAADEQADAEKEMYQEAGMGAEKYFSAEATELVKKAARWKAAGADTYQTEQWLYEQLGKLSEDAWAKGETAAGQAMDTMQNMSETLVDQYNAANTSIVDQLTAVGLKVDELDGQNIGLTASFDGGMVVTGIDALIAKFQAMRAAASSAAAASAGAMTSSDSSLSISSSSSDQSSSSSSTGSDSASTGGVSNSVTVNVNQQLSRSDVNSIVSEQKRLAGRM